MSVCAYLEKLRIEILWKGKKAMVRQLTDAILRLILKLKFMILFCMVRALFLNIWKSISAQI